MDLSTDLAHSANVVGLDDPAQGRCCLGILPYDRRTGHVSFAHCCLRFPALFRILHSRIFTLDNLGLLTARDWNIFTTTAGSYSPHLGEFDVKQPQPTE